MDETNAEWAHPGVHSTEALSEVLVTKTIGLAGMTSDRWVKKIEEVFRQHHGVKEVVVNRDNATARVTFDSRATNMAELHDTLLQLGPPKDERVLV